MKLRKLRVEQLRQFRRAVEIRDLQPGINLFTGANESGKSTLVRAIRAAFFERFRSSSVDDLQPWGDSSATPTVELEFEWQEQCWHLNKTFLRQKRCDLQIAGRPFNGEEAEEKLADLLGYEFSGRGASRAENWGIPGLLWVEQGAGQDLNDAVNHAGAHLQSALGESLGELASSSGDELISQVETERNKLRTTSTGRPTGELQKANQAVSDLQAQQADLIEKIGTYRQQVDRLGALLQETQQDHSRPWDALRKQAGAAQQRLNEVDGWAQEQVREQQSLQQSHQSHELCREHLSASSRLQDSLTARRNAVALAQTEVDGLQAQEQPLQEHLSQARKVCQDARERLVAARRQSQRSALASELAVLEQQLAEASSKLEGARVQQASLLRLRERLQATVVDETQLKRLRQVASELDRVHIRREAAATRLHYALLPGQSLELDGEPISGEAERLLSAPATLEIPGIGRLQISPGGEDLVELDLRRQQLEDERVSLLQLLQVASLDEAERRADLSRLLEEDIALAQLKLEQLAPKGLEPLSETLRLGASRQSDLRQQIDVIPEETQELVLTVEQAEREQQRAMDGLAEADKAVSDHRLDASLSAQKLQSATDELQRLQNELNAPERQQREQQLRGQLVSLEAEIQRLQQSIAARQQQIDNARPDILKQDVQRLTDSAKALEEAASLRTLEIARLQSGLETAGAQGLDEQLATVEQELETMRRRQSELIRRADGLELLLEMLKAKRHALTQRLQAPLQKHLNRYLQLLFPQAHLSVDEHLKPTHLVRSVNGSQEQGDIGALSFGAREQMGLISRLAYADLLQEAGRPTLIILDDALVHSDQQRLEQMKRVLFDSAQRHQVLLFTCHPENWRDLGVVARDIEALKAAV